MATLLETVQTNEEKSFLSSLKALCVRYGVVPYIEEGGELVFKSEKEPLDICIVPEEIMEKFWNK